ncbi:major facilitator superfamily domain-containing protein [Desarmillaria tabescens]|uniref:Major facilitator superfamily domain-containing protein n=1 Tax=Armillaria tabescens TaxID=1929756 RepID=A0AA39MKZ9_ARMTA|nr:major facilitator superfamily domain-containing protein [Desarmillaria tabescens]KAK0437763.1 major facilitator superfamily domain-containing protein [Desarmillaria tabescens]
MTLSEVSPDSADDPSPPVDSGAFSSSDTLVVPSPRVSDPARDLVDTDKASSPDGGYGWICVFCSFIVHFFALGIESSWGVYQSHYFTSRDLGPISNSDLAWVGSIQATGQPLVGILAGILAQRIGYRLTGFIGTCIMCIGLISASFSTHVWHLYLTQGVLFGIGSGFAFIPAVCIPSQWFTKHRGLATGIAASGYGVGGLLLSPFTQRLIDLLGFRWALRITGLMTLVALGVADIFLRPRASAKPATKVDKTLLTDNVFLFLCSIGLLSGPGFYVPIFYVPGTFRGITMTGLTILTLLPILSFLVSFLNSFVPDYAINKLERSAQDGANAAALISAFSAAGRVLVGIVGDRLGHLPVLSLCQCMGGIAQMAIWPFAGSLSGLMAFSSIYGFFTGGYVSLYPVVAADLYGVEGLASITGIMFSSFVPGTLLGPPISGAILDSHTNPLTGKINFLPVQLFGGSWLLGSASMAVMVQIFHAKEGSIALA